MDPIQNMEQHKGQFTRNDRIIYDAIMRNPDQITYQSTSELAKACGVSQPALSRFVKMLGYARYQEFRSEMTAWVARQQVAADPNRLFYFERLQCLMDAAERVLTDELMRDLAAYVRGCDRLLATGIGKSLHPALLLQALSRKLDLLVHVCPLDVVREYADHMRANDLLVVFSVSTRPELMEKVKATQGKVLLVTTNPAHDYQGVVDRTVVLPFLPPDPETSSVSPVLFDVFVELLVSYLLHDR